MTWLTRLVSLVVRSREQAAQGLVEYGLILTLIAIVSIVALAFLGGQLSGQLNVIGSTVNSAAP